MTIRDCDFCGDKITGVPTQGNYLFVGEDRHDLCDSCKWAMRKIIDDLKLESRRSWVELPELKLSQDKSCPLKISSERSL